MTALHVLFKVGDSEYVLPADSVVQMESYQGATRLPGGASYLAGLVQIRGQVIPVIDLRARFGLPAVTRELDARVIVVKDGERQVGLLADSAREVIRIDEEAFHPPPDVVAEQTGGFVGSIAQAGKRLVMRLDFQKVISQDSVVEEHHGQEA